MLYNKESVTCEKKRVTEQAGENATKLACVQEIGEGRGGCCTQATKFEAPPVLFLSGVFICSRCRRCCLNLPPSRELKQQRRQRQRKRLLKSELGDQKRGLWERDWSLCQHGGPRMARDSVAHWDKVTLVKRTRRAHHNQPLLIETPA